MITPMEFYKETVGKAWDIDHAWGVQCHDLAQKYCDDLNIPKSVIWCGNTGYAHDIWDRRNISGILDYFDVITDPAKLQTGDMVIFPTSYSQTPLSHVCFFYEINGIKYAYGQRQGGNREARLISSLNFYKMAGAFRPKVWAKEDSMNKGKHKGCDVSEWQNPENTDISDYEFVIIRASYTTTEDKYCDAWVKKCESLGKPYGFYCYSYATSTQWALEEARKFIEIISRYNPTMGLWLDMEDADHYKQEHWEGYLDPDLITAISEAWLERVAQEGYYTGIYASQSWFGNIIKDTPIMQKYDKWVASWKTNDGKINCDTSYMGTMLQYTSAGGLDKDITYIDLNVYDVKKKKEEKKEESKEVEELKKELEKLRKDNELLRSILKKIAELLGL